MLFIGLVAIISVVTFNALLDSPSEPIMHHIQNNPNKYTQYSYSISESSPILAVIPENLSGGLSFFNFGRSSWAFPSFSFKSHKTLLFSLFREKQLGKRFINAPEQDGKGEIVFFMHSKSYFVYNLREIIV